MSIIAGNVSLGNVFCRSLLSHTTGGNVCIASDIIAGYIITDQISPIQKPTIFTTDINFPYPVIMGENSSLVLSPLVIGSGSTAIGSSAMTIGHNSNAGGNYSLAIGKSASCPSASGIAIGTSATTNIANPKSIAIGYNASSSGYYSIAIRASAAGANGVSIGFFSSADTMYSICVGSSVNVGGNGAIAMSTYANANGTRSIVFGRSSYVASSDGIALGYTTTCNGNQGLAIGSGITTNNYGMAIGYAADSSTSSYNFTIGSFAEAQGTYSIAIGSHAYTASTGYEAVAIGPFSQTLENQGIAIGVDAQCAIENFIAIGPKSRANLAYGVPVRSCVVIGYLTNSIDNVSVMVGTTDKVTYTRGGAGALCIGHSCFANATNPTLIGNNIMASALRSIAIGTNITTTTETYHMVIGGGTSADVQSIAIGHGASCTTAGSGSQIAIGYNAYSDVGPGAYSGSVTIGRNATNMGTKDCIAIGADTTIASGRSYATVIGFEGSASANNQVTFGSITEIRADTTVLHTISDGRDKTDIENSRLGIEFIKKIRPVKFRWDRREWYPNGKPDGSFKDIDSNLGLVAQEVQKVQQETQTEWLDIVLDSDPNHLEVAEGKLRLILLKAIQELVEKNNALETEIDQLSVEALDIQKGLESINAIKGSAVLAVN